MLKKYSKFDGKRWRELLINHPELSKHCDWTLLGSYDWSELLLKQPQLAEYRR